MIKQRIYVTLALVVSAIVSLADENYENKVVATHGDWTTNAVYDVFDEVPVAWLAFISRDIDMFSKQQVFLMCDTRDNSVRLLARAANLTGTLTELFSSEKTIEVSIKIDDEPVRKYKGKPQNILVEGDDLAKLLPVLQLGDKVRIRTIHGKEMHTFVASLKGFKQASEWVLNSCPVKLK